MRLDPAALAREAARALEDEIAVRGIAARRSRSRRRLPRVLGHADALVQVLVNLAEERAEAALSGGPEGSGPRRRPSRLSVTAENGTVLFVVEDNGPGLPPQAADRVFEPFFSTKTSQGGTGLGLTIARDIIRAHGGSLDVAPRPDGGARFVVALPPAP